jgi:hypothetical protein
MATPPSPGENTSQSIVGVVVGKVAGYFNFGDEPQGKILGAFDDFFAGRSPGIPPGLYTVTESPFTRTTIEGQP